MSEIEELIAYLETQETTPTVDRLISKVKEQDREIERLQKLEGIAQEMVNNWNEFEQPMPLEWDMPDPMRTIHEWASEWNGAAKKAKARVKELEELLGEETYAERAAVRHYKRIKELEEGLGECCRMFEWCDVRYGRLLAEKEKV